MAEFVAVSARTPSENVTSTSLGNRLAARASTGGLVSARTVKVATLLVTTKLMFEMVFEATSAKRAPLSANTAGLALIVLGLVFFIAEIEVLSYGLLTLAGLDALEQADLPAAGQFLRTVADPGGGGPGRVDHEQHPAVAFGAPGAHDALRAAGRGAYGRSSGIRMR